MSMEDIGIGANGNSDCTCDTCRTERIVKKGPIRVPLRELRSEYTPELATSLGVKPPMKSLESLEKDLMAAESRLEKARVEYSRAREEEAAALASLNLLQRHIDDTLEQYRSSAPNNTDWSNRPVAVDFEQQSHKYRQDRT
jgi:hypothetical protein